MNETDFFLCAKGGAKEICCKWRKIFVEREVRRVEDKERKQGRKVWSLGNGTLTGDSAEGSQGFSE